MVVHLFIPKRMMVVHLFIPAVKICFCILFKTSITCDFTGVLELTFQVEKVAPDTYHLSGLARGERIMKLWEHHNSSRRISPGKLGEKTGKPERVKNFYSLDRLTELSTRKATAKYQQHRNR